MLILIVLQRIVSGYQTTLLSLPTWITVCDGLADWRLTQRLRLRECRVVNRASPVRRLARECNSKVHSGDSDHHRKEVEEVEASENVLCMLWCWYCGRSARGLGEFSSCCEPRGVVRCSAALHGCNIVSTLFSWYQGADRSSSM